jgi:hypothetical protein
MQIGFFIQIKDILPVLVISLISGFIAYSPSLLMKESYFQLGLGGIFGSTFFIGAAFLFKFSELKELSNFLLKKNK